MLEETVINSGEPLTRRDVEKLLGVRPDPERGGRFKVAADGRPPYTKHMVKAANILVGYGLDQSAAVEALEEIGLRRILHLSRQRLLRARKNEETDGAQRLSDG